MSSSPDLPAAGEEGRLVTSGPPEVVDGEGRRRGGRRRRLTVVALLGVVGVGVPVVAVLAGDKEPVRQVNVAADGEGPASDSISDPLALPAIEPVPPPTVAPPPPSPPIDLAAPVAAAPSTTVATATSTTAPAGATTTTLPQTLPCRNSVQIACGPFRWDPPPPANRPLVATFVSPPATAEAGQPVTFAVSWSDGDAALTESSLSTGSSVLSAACPMTARYGPWTPPDARPSSGTEHYSHTFAAAGPYQVVVVLTTSDCMSPHSSDARVETTVVVA